MRFLPVLLLAVSPFLARAADLPPRPETGVVDTAQVLPLPILKATERVLTEHRELTQETVFLVVLRESPSEGLDERARAMLEAWRAETPKPPNTVILAVDAEKGKLSVQSGIGLDAAIGPGSGHAREIRDLRFKPEWSAGRKDRAVVLALMGALDTLESPLVTSGEAADTYERAGFAGGWVPREPSAGVSFTWLWMVFGAAVFAFALYRTLAVEVHTTGEGWHRVPVSEVLTRRLRKSKAPPLVTGGGVSGSY
jgi:uncharacterized membrane protein YgcG